MTTPITASCLISTIHPVTLSPRRIETNIAGCRHAMKQGQAPLPLRGFPTCTGRPWGAEMRGKDEDVDLRVSPIEERSMHACMYVCMVM